MKAERETVDRLIAHFLADRVGAHVRGPDFRRRRARACSSNSTIPAPTASFRPRRSGRDYYRYEEGLHALIGQATGETFRLGDRVQVKLVEAAPVAGALRFEMLSEGGARPPRGARMQCSAITAGTKGPAAR